MTIQFDDGAADSAVTIFTHASAALANQGPARRSLAEEAHEDFSGSYATLLTKNCAAESEERGRLVGVLDTLVGDIAEAKALAREERLRLQALADWQGREDQRNRERASDPSGSAHLDAAWRDPRPSTVPVTPPTMSAAFHSGSRTREVSGRSASGKSSADPVKLRRFASQSTVMNGVLSAEVVSVQNAWARFAGSCSWVSFGTVTFGAGFARMMSENTADAAWIERVAARFERAGGGVLNSSLNTAAKSTVLELAAQQRFTELLAGRLSPADAAEFWASLGLTASDVRLLPPETLLQLASMPGLPAWAQDAAGREFIEYALMHPGVAYEMMGFAQMEFVDPSTGVQTTVGVGGGVTLADFVTQLQGIKDELTAAKNRSADLNGGAGDVVQLVDFGSHDGVLAAGISIGDLDTASNIGVNVSGMDSSVKDMGNGNQAAHELHQAAYDRSPIGTFAVVNWVGYRSPTMGEVHSMDRADSGAGRLLSFLNGMNASRLEQGATPEQFNVYAHSYGSTTAAEALKRIDAGIVDRLVTYGSAGLKSGTTLSEIHVGKVYSTHANGDGVAKFGQHGQKPVDPRDIGAQKFSSENAIAADGTALKRTTMHSMYREKDEWTFSNMWAGSVGYLSRGSTSLDRMANLLVNGTATK